MYHNVFRYFLSLNLFCCLHIYIYYTDSRVVQIIHIFSQDIPLKIKVIEQHKNSYRKGK